MTTLIKLTRARTDVKGKIVYVNPAQITNIYRWSDNKVTVVKFNNDDAALQVEETLEEIAEMVFNAEHPFHQQKKEDEKMPENLKGMIKTLIDRWGDGLQYIITMEQCSQLATECSHQLRWGNNAAKITERVADMLIMCETMKIIFGIDEDKIWEIQLNKLTEGLRKM